MAGSILAGGAILKVRLMLHRRGFMGMVLSVALAALCGSCATDAGDSAPDGNPLRADSITLDLFSLNAVLRTRNNAGELTPLGNSLRMDFDSTVTVGEQVVIRTEKRVRTYAAYFLHEHDIHCDGVYQGDAALLILFDDSMPGKCRDTVLADVPAYPYRTPVAVNFLEGKGFWIGAGQVEFARGKLEILFDYFP